MYNLQVHETLNLASACTGAGERAAHDALVPLPVPAAVGHAHLYLVVDADHACGRGVGAG